MRSCSHREETPQENYLFTQYVNKFGANEIFISINYNFGTRTNAMFDVLVYESTGVKHMESLNRDNYELLETITLPSNSRTGSALLSFIPKETTKGFYLGFRETGTCITVTRLSVFAHICPEQVNGLVHYPQTFAPPRESGSVVDATGACLANSSRVNGMSTSSPLQCAALGTWLEPEDCQCNPGYIMTGSVNKSCEGKLMTPLTQVH